MTPRSCTTQDARRRVSHLVYAPLYADCNDVPWSTTAPHPTRLCVVFGDLLRHLRCLRGLLARALANFQHALPRHLSQRQVSRRRSHWDLCGVQAHYTTHWSKVTTVTCCPRGRQSGYWDYRYERAHRAWGWFGPGRGPRERTGYRWGQFGRMSKRLGTRPRVGFGLGFRSGRGRWRRGVGRRRWMRRVGRVGGCVWRRGQRGRREQRRRRGLRRERIDLPVCLACSVIVTGVGVT